MATEQTGVLAVLTKPSKIFEAFDCPRCGCQNIVNIREQAVGRSRGEEDDSMEP